MIKKRLFEELSFEEYVRMYCMPTRTLDTKNYKIIEIKDCDWE